MALETVTWTPDDVSADDAAQWDLMAAGRGAQADIYNSHAWFDAWRRATPELDGRVAVPAVLDEGTPVALMPLVRRRGLWMATSSADALRLRPVVAAGSGHRQDVMMSLVDQMGRSGMVEIDWRGLPTRDPATASLIRALRRSGYHVDVRTTTTDNIIEVRGNERFDRTQRKLVSSTRPRERRVRPFWDLEVTTFGAGGVGSVAEGLGRFDDVQSLSWQGMPRRRVTEQRRSFLQVAEARGWVRLTLLSFAGRPVAGNIWFKVGDVAIGWLTAYDQRVGSLAPGIILHRYVQEAIRGEDPAVLDLLPGKNPFKESLEVARPPLVTVSASRQRSVAGATFPARLALRQQLRRSTHQLRMKAGRARASIIQTPSIPRPRHRSRLFPAHDPVPGLVSPCDLERSTPLQRFLAVALALPNASAVLEDPAGHQWWYVAGQAEALLQVDDPPQAQEGDSPPRIRHVIPLAAGTRLDAVGVALATHLGEPVDLDVDASVPLVATEEDLPALPWVPLLLETTAPPPGDVGPTA